MSSMAQRGHNNLTVLPLYWQRKSRRVPRRSKPLTSSPFAGAGHDKLPGKAWAGQLPNSVDWTTSAENTVSRTSNKESAEATLPSPLSPPRQYGS
ncbi:hypothetical protein E2562_007181 [Oryza meyeriana var. granulata]|uniref:Uncharacterized protein n=1 Tax=Oryza meyeriana var. granulata TaxID=110450 RepID=A0A6G1CDV9_9ORYZ|nr:hypothetical protein E2562_007181 [Oryza meyeriana var. granulata]